LFKSASSRKPTLTSTYKYSKHRRSYRPSLSSEISHPTRRTTFSLQLV
jgi:hypothetical protein